MARHSLSSRRATTTAQKTPEEFKEKIVDYILFVEQKRRTLDYKHIFAADETAVYIDFSNSLTVEERGTKDVSKFGCSSLNSKLQVPVKTTGHDKLHITVMLTARSDGYKCRSFVLIPRVKPIKDIIIKFKNKLQLCWAGTGQTFFNDDLTSEYLKSIIGQSFFGDKRLLAWDSYRCHISSNTKKVLKQLQVDTVVIPGGCTKFIQVC
jgi:hypothetical protein